MGGISVWQLLIVLVGILLFLGIFNKPIRKERVPRTAKGDSAGQKSTSDATLSVAAKRSDYELGGSGTGFSVGKKHVVTAYHVVEKCDLVTVVHQSNEILANVVAFDRGNDIALLRLDTAVHGIAKLREDSSLREGEFVATYGYPLHGLLSQNAKITTGVINSLAGIANDSTVFQYDAATQNGNSGGPVLDQAGNLVGIVQSGLAGYVVQNVNFAAKASTVSSFLSANNVKWRSHPKDAQLETPDIASKAAQFTVLVMTWELRERGGETSNSSRQSDEEEYKKETKKDQKLRKKREKKEAKKIKKEELRQKSKRALKQLFWIVVIVTALLVYFSDS